MSKKVKMTRSELDILVIEMLELESQQINEGIMETAKLGAIITMSVPDVIKIAQADPNVKGGDGYKQGITNIIERAGSPKKAIDIAYKIFSGSLIEKVISLAKGRVQAKQKAMAKAKGQTYKEWSTDGLPMNVSYIRKLISYTNNKYPGILTDNIISKFSKYIKKLIESLNPYADGSLLVSKIFEGFGTSSKEQPKNPQSQPAVSSPPPEQQQAIPQAEPEKKQNIVSFFEDTAAEDAELIQEFVDEFYGSEGESIDFNNLSLEELDDMADEFFDMYGFDPRVSLDIYDPETEQVEEPTKVTDEVTPGVQKLDPDVFVGPEKENPKSQKTPVAQKKKRKSRLSNLIKRFKK